jgi:DNA-binding winged helix-turn-helix (wHTH) protein/TolB-like protein
MDSGNAVRRIGFGPFEFDVAGGELYRDGQRVRLQEQPRQLLAALLERPGEICTREDLRERLWASDTFVDFEHGLNTAIKKLRQALGDSAEAPQFVETLARRGYRFVAPVVARLPVPQIADSPVLPGPVPVPTAPLRPARGPSRLRRARWGGSLLLLAAAAAVVWVAPQRREGASPAPAQQRAPAQLAVMPLRVLGGPEAAEASYLGIGIADAITTRLANFRQLALRPTAATLTYKDAQADHVRIAATLGVQHLLVGTIQPGEHTYRVNVQLVSAEGVVVWGQIYDQPRAGLLELQDRIAEQVASALRIELSAPERARLQVRSTQNPAAHDLYLQGRALMAKYTEVGMREALAHFEQAIGLDQHFALARAALATSAAWFSVRYAYEEEALQWGKRADDEARRALQEDPSLAEAHVAIASAAGTLYRGFDWNTVLERTATALALDPSLDLAHVVRMRAFYHLGYIDEAQQEARLARVLNPFPSVETARLEVATQLFAGQYAAAAERSAELLKRTDAPAVRHYLGLARYYTGDIGGAREMLASAKRGGRRDVRAQASLASLEAAGGLRTEARARATAIAAGSYMDHHVAYSLGATFAQLGDAAATVEWLQRAVDTGFPCFPWFERDPLLDPMRRDPAFVRFFDRLRAAHEQNRPR